ncbi:hypothetical protein THRCLA_23477 [Thraustotheca clavata]|uniref:Reverse transcriptase domain-containing protein n=1 Tax=Thraustotheca clavata TaxID=74557 RepID=A0A1V9Y433_9STRA|nr:hypothetical protein THRCLA_23477 [Thraustotheca clavata]
MAHDGLPVTMNPHKSPGPDGWPAAFFQIAPQTFSEILLKIIFSNSLGSTIKPNRGVKQGCPLSCLLFVFYIEPLGSLLRELPHLGITLPDGSTLTSIFFADDSNLLSNSFEAAIAQLAQLDLVEEFCAVSGAQLNLAKCMTLVLNEHEDPAGLQPPRELNVVPSGQPVTYLGILFGHKLPTDLQIH